MNYENLYKKNCAGQVDFIKYIFKGGLMPPIQNAISNCTSNGVLCKYALRKKIV